MSFYYICNGFNVVNLYLALLLLFLLSVVFFRQIVLTQVVRDTRAARRQLSLSHV